MRPEGVYVATITPFDSEKKLLLPALRAHLESLARAGVHGFVPCGTTGETATLNRVERWEVLSVALEVARREGLKVIAGCGGNNTAAVLELIQEAKELGCDAALVVTPYYNKPTAAGLVAHYRYLADRGGLPILPYNVPGRTNVHLGLDSVREIFDHPQIVGLKEASGNWSHWLGLAHSLNLAGKALMAGDDDAMAPILALGGTGIISASANVAPEPFVALYKAAKEGRLHDAFQWQKKLYPLTRSLFLETNPAPVKFALEALGRGEANLRLPLVPIGRSTEEAVLAAMKNLEMLA